MRKRSYNPPRPTLLTRFRRWRYRLRYRHWPLLECEDFQSGGFCKGESSRHRCCNNCGAVTCSASLKIDARSLRRHWRAECDSCKWKSLGDPHQAALRSKRTKQDWEHISAPVNRERIIAGQMGEQYPGVSRETIRAFRESGAVTAIAPDVDAASLQQTISVLGLEDEMYAETRGDETVLRRIQ